MELRVELEVLPKLLKMQAATDKMLKIEDFMVKWECFLAEEICGAWNCLEEERIEAVGCIG